MKTIPFCLLFVLISLSSNGQKNLFDDPIFRSLPRKVDLKPYLTPIKSQERRNSCGTFAVTAMVEAEIKRVYGKEVNLSEEYFIYNEQHTPSSESGSKRKHVLIGEKNLNRKHSWLDLLSFCADLLGGCGFSDAVGTEEKAQFIDNSLLTNQVRVLLSGVNLPFVAEEQWPYHPSFSNRDYPCGCNLNFTQTNDFCTSHFTPPVKLKEKAFTANYHIGFFNYPGTADTTRAAKKELFEMLNFLSKKKRPLLFEISLDSYKSDSIIYTVEKKVRLFPIEKSPPDKEAYLKEYFNHFEDHIMLITGYDLDKQLFYVRNSWGAEVGFGGYGRLPMGDIISPDWKYMVNALRPESAFLYMELQPQKNVNIPLSSTEKFKLSVFEASVKKDWDGSLKVSVNFDAENIGLHDVIVQSQLLVKDSQLKNTAIKMDYFGNTPDNKVKILTMLSSEKSLLNDSVTVKQWVHLGDSIPVTHLQMTKEKPLVIEYPKGFTRSKSYQSILADKSKKMVLKVAFYYYNDTGAFNAIKEQYFEMN